MNVLVELLVKKQLSISTCESFTAGLFAYELGKIPGVSEVYKGSVIAYQSEMKHTVLGIDSMILDTYGVVSREVAQQMAQAGQSMFDSDVCISFTGNAGPNVLEGKACGLWFACIRYRDQQFDFEFLDSMERNLLRVHAVQTMTSKLVEIIRDMPN
jgi:PncC family amidohydrolase